MSRATSLPADNFTVLLTLIAFRLLNSVTVRTFFQPDEYYQALEPAWSFAYGGNGAWITWEWAQHLRSAIHPALFGAIYYTVGLLVFQSKNLELRDGCLLFGPKVAQAVIAAVGDFYTWKLSKRVYGDSRLSSVTLGLTILSPWQWFCSTRTFSNGLESTLTVAALYHWPFEWSLVGTVPKQLRRALLLAATATVMRPTNLLIWIVLALDALLSLRSRAATSSKGNIPRSTFLILAREGVLCGGIVLTLSAIVDRAFYGVWTFPAANFLYFNVVQSLAVFYGNNDWHYYLSQGYPLLLTTALPFALLGIYNIFSSSSSHQKLSPTSRKSLFALASISIVLPAALSVLSHKEVRFIYPILGPLHVIAAAPVLRFLGPVFSSTTNQPLNTAQSKFLRTLLILLLISLNLLIGGYTTLIHNAGIIALPEYLRNEFTTHYLSPPPPPPPPPPSTSTSTSPGLQNLTLAILMPCHSLPWRSHLLNPPTPSQPGIQAWALTCEPPLHLSNNPSLKSTYLDEADIFYANPTLWLRKTMSPLAPSTFKFPPTTTNHHPSPGIHTPKSNKYLWTSQNHPTSPNLDITDLLPYLQTNPDHPPRIDTEDLPRRPWPHYLAFFAHLEPTLTQALRGSGYTECWRTFNSHWHDDWRRTGDVVVWCLFPERARGGRGKRDDVDGGGDGVVEMEKSETMKAPERAGTQTVVRP